ncbi:protein kinase [Pendulispora brunnea]|uniref:Protein kinase n=1 Tax=Pendulispora brunnea TaxID=2905690 RepID=A0ABZ2KIB5_9BACT
MTSVGKYTLLQELNDREAPTYAARCAGLDGASELVAIERYATDIAADAEDEASLAEAARGGQILTELYHPNLASVRDVVASSGEVLVVSAFVDGDSYGKLMPAGREKSFDAFPFALKLAIVSDVIEGLAALHEFARAHDTIIVHGGVTPRNVIVCADGRARLVRVCNLFPEQVSPASPTLGYIAPELLDPTRRPEPSVDVFGAGVMLWEVLAGKRLAVQTNAPLLLLKEFDKGPPRGIPQEELSWAKAFIPIVERALSSSDKRYKDAEQMARAMRAVFAAAGEQVKTRATVKDVAEFIEEVSGDRIRERRAELGFSAPLPLTASRATIAPMRSRPSLPELPSLGSVPLPLPPPPARIYLPSLVDEDEFSSRGRIASASPLPSSLPPRDPSMDQEDLPAMDQDENLSALAPIVSPNDTLIIDEKSRESFWVGGDPTDEREAIKASNPPPGFDDGERKFEDDDEDDDGAVSGTAETVLHRTSQGKLEAREKPAPAPAPVVKAESSFPPPAPPPPRQSLFEDRREQRRPVVWGGVVLAVAAALVFGYGLGRGQKPAPGQAAAPVTNVNVVPVASAAPAPPARVSAEITNAEPVAQPAAAEPAPSGEPEAAKDAPAAAKPQPATEIELVPEGARSTARRPRPAAGHAGARPSPSEGSAPSGGSAPAAPAATSTTSPAPDPSASQGQTDGRQKFNPQGI